MSNRMKFALAGAIIGIIVLIFAPWVGVAIIALALVIPLVGYLMLDPSQRKRVRGIGRKQIGR